MKNFNGVHYDNFKQRACYQQDWEGSNVRNWFNDVMLIYYKRKYNELNGMIPNNALDLPNEKLTRARLKEICSDKNFSDLECLAAVMAWGGQNRNYGAMLFSRRNEVLPVVKKLRQGRSSPKEAYSEFLEIWEQDKPLGMGAAYFTKLIFFCDPNHKGFIMDQWTAKSVNLICGEKIVDLQGGYVSKKNDAEVYEHFCNIIGKIAKDLDKSEEKIEIAMFSKGGRKKDAWREYVVREYEKFHKGNLCGSP